MTIFACVFVQSRIHTIVIIAPQFHSNDKLIMVTVCVTCDKHYDGWHLAVLGPFFSSALILPSIQMQYHLQRSFSCQWWASTYLTN